MLLNRIDLTKSCACSNDAVRILDGLHLIKATVVQLKREKLEKVMVDLIVLSL